MNFDEVSLDLSAFADDPSDVLVERDGSVIIVRGGREISFSIRQEDFGLVVIQDQTKTPYLKFLCYNIAGLDIFAERLLSKRAIEQVFINGPAKLERVEGSSIEGPALELIDIECRDASPFSSRVVFVTGDAGHGKTALLREYQVRQARNFLDGHSRFLFWHVDLQGRQLLRLHEALMGDLGELRISGLWMAGIIRLIRYGMLILAIDGFDELAAEQGSKDALNALAAIVQNMEDKGVIVAASRRTFFDTEDYTRRTGLIKRRVSNNCQFDQIKLLNWSRSENIKYLGKICVDGKLFGNPNNTYEEMLAELNSDDTHPMLTRPFLFTHLSKGLLRYDITASEFIKGMTDPLEGVAEIVRAFIQREVSEKWKVRETGEPYLTIDQHMEFLANVAQEMWSNQMDRLPTEIIETIAVLLLDDWNIEESRKRQILEMVRMHVMLTIPSDGDEKSRTFDHPEFRNYFVAHFLSHIIKDSVDKNKVEELGSFLSIAQLPDRVAKYAATMIDKDTSFINKLVSLFNNIVQKEWKPTYLQINIGTILPCILDGYIGEEIIKVVGNIVYSSLVFENTKLKNILIQGGNFINVSFLQVDWENIEFLDCDFSEIKLDRTGIFKNVYFTSCTINGIRLSDNDEEIRGYSPQRIIQIMKDVGIQLKGDNIEEIICPPLENEYRKSTNRLLRIFLRTTVITESIINLKFKYSQVDTVFKNILPLMQKYGLIELKPWRGRGTSKSLWVLKRSLDDILRAECGEGDPNIVNFWQEIDNLSN